MNEVTASPPLRIAGATSYAVLCVLSLSLNAVLVTIFVKVKRPLCGQRDFEKKVQHRKDYIKSSFYVLTWQLIVGDVLTQAIELVVAVPITYTALPVRATLWFSYTRERSWGGARQDEFSTFFCQRPKVSLEAPAADQFS